MFTGIVEARVAVRALEPRGAGARLVLPAPDPGWQAARGESVSVSGCCLTVAGISPLDDGGREFAFDLSAETLERTWFGELAPGRLVNLERALRLSDRLGGHLVSGHVDAIGSIAASVDSKDGGRVLTFEVPSGFERYLIDKGSVTIDGVSLTVVSPRDRRFDVALIPSTLEATNLRAAAIGQRVNLEADLVGKWIERLTAAAIAARV